MIDGEVNEDAKKDRESRGVRNSIDFSKVLGNPRQVCIPSSRLLQYVAIRMGGRQRLSGRVTVAQPGKIMLTYPLQHVSVASCLANPFLQ